MRDFMKKLLFIVTIFICNYALADYTIRPGYDLNATIKLFNAVRINNQESAEQAIKENADVDAKDMNDFAPLHYAAKKSPTLLSLLIEHGANVNITRELSKNGFSLSPLCDAILQNMNSSIKILLEAGAEIPDESIFDQFSQSNKTVTLNAIIKEINQERKELKALATLNNEVRPNTGITNTIKSLLLDSDNKSFDPLPLISEVFAQRAAAKERAVKKIQRFGRSMQARTALPKKRSLS